MTGEVHVPLKNGVKGQSLLGCRPVDMQQSPCYSVGQSEYDNMRQSATCKNNLQKRDADSHGSAASSRHWNFQQTCSVERKSSYFKHLIFIITRYFHGMYNIFLFSLLPTKTSIYCDSKMRMLKPKDYITRWASGIRSTQSHTILVICL